MSQQIPFGKPNITEKEIQGILTVMESGILVHGNVTKNFEEAFSKELELRMLYQYLVVLLAYI